MASVAKAVEDINEAINSLKTVKDSLLPSLAVLDNNSESAASMKEFIEKRISELEVLKEDLVINSQAIERCRSALGL